MTSEFNKWLAGEVDKGLVAIHVNSLLALHCSDIPVAAAQFEKEVLAAERAIAAKEFRNPPLPRDFNLAEIDRVIKNSSMEL